MKPTSTTIRVDADRAVELLSAVVVECGADHLYVSPVKSGANVYAHQDEPCCLVGQALHRAGIPMAVLTEWGDTAIDGLDFPKELEITDQAVDVLSAAQRLQDSGSTWGTVLNAVENHVHSENSV